MKYFKWPWLVWLVAIIIMAIIIFSNISKFDEWKLFVLLADLFISLGVTLVSYSGIVFLLMFVFRRTDKISQKTYELNNLRGKISLSFGAIAEGIGFYLNTRYGYVIGGKTFIMGGYLELYGPGEISVPPTLLYGFILGLLIILWLNNKIVLKIVKCYLIKKII